MSGTDRGAFWRFSLVRYAAPGVAAGCLQLQDREGADVNLLLLALWLGELGHRLDQEGGIRLADLAAGWQDPIVSPLRMVRRRLKERQDAPWAETVATWRRRIAEAELAMEELEQRILEQAVGRLALAAPDPEAANANLAALGLGRLLKVEAWHHLLRTVGDGGVAVP